MRIELDGNVVRRIDDLPAYMRPLVRRTIKRMQRLMVEQTRNNILMGGAGDIRFVPVVRINTTSGTETIPANATTAIQEVWGSGGGSTDGVGVGCGADNGSNGGSSGYVRSSYTVAALGGSNKTLTHTIGAVGVHGTVATNTDGGDSTIVAGTVTGFTSMTGGGGKKATGTRGTGLGLGGTAAGGNQANTAGTAGNQTGTTGTVSGDGSPYGGGGGAGPPGVGNPGTNGLTGAAVYAYT